MFSSNKKVFFFIQKLIYFFFVHGDVALEIASSTRSVFFNITNSTNLYEKRTVHSSAFKTNETKPDDFEKIQHFCKKVSKIIMALPVHIWPKIDILITRIIDFDSVALSSAG